MINTHPLQMIGRDKIVEQVIDRLQRPDDVRNVPKKFISPGFYGVAGIGKSRLIKEVAGRAAQLTPYVVHVDLDPRAGSVVPGTPLALVRYLMDVLEEQERQARPVWQRAMWERRNPFKPCRQIIEEFETTPVSQKIIAIDSEISDISQIVDQSSVVLERLVQAFAQALGELCVRGQTRVEFGRVGKPKPRPLVVVLLDTVELASKPLRQWLPQLPSLLGARNTLNFHLMWVAAGRQELAGVLETPLPPLSPSEAAAFVRTYVSYRRKLDWTQRWAGLSLLRDGPMLDGVVALGQGIPLLLQLLADVTALEPQALAAWAKSLPAQYEARFRYVMEHYLTRLRAHASAQSDDQLWQSYYLLLYGALPRRLPGVGLLRALLQDLPGTPFESRTNYDDLYQRLTQEAYVERTAEGTLVFHDLVREGALTHLQQSDPEQWQRLHRRAATWFEEQGEQAEGFYHAAQSDYQETIEGLKDSIVQALEAGEWAKAQELITTTTPIPLTAEDEAWITLYKADLTWGEENQSLALQRLRRLYGKEMPPTLREAVATRLERWLGFDSEIEKKLRQDPSLGMPSDFIADVLWWAKQRDLPALQAHALLLLGEMALRQDWYGKAKEVLERVLALYEAAADRWGQARALLLLGEVARMQDRHGEAKEVLERALALYEAVEDRRGQAHALGMLGEVARRQAQLGEAKEVLERALALYEAVEDRRGQARALLSLGEVALMQTQYGKAKEVLERALALSEAVEDRRSQAQAMLFLGDMARRQAQLGEAKEVLERALALSEAVEDRRGQAQAMLFLGDIAQRQARYGDAKEVLERALALYEALADRWGQAYALLLLGDIAQRQARYGEAKEVVKRALVLSEAVADRWGQAHALRELGEVALRQARYGEAKEVLERALARYGAVADRLGQAHALGMLGEVALGQARYGEAQARLDEAFQLYASIGLSQKVLRSFIHVGRDSLDQHDAHRTKGEGKLAREAYVLASHLCQWADRFASQVSGSDDTRALLQQLNALRCRLAECGERYSDNSAH